jgi:UDP-N-acetylglucosamine 1-carboxyvinyltransferase
MLIAGLATVGETEVIEIERIDRGYEDVVEKFTSLGANIKRIV